MRPRENLLALILAILVGACAPALAVRTPAASPEAAAAAFPLSVIDDAGRPVAIASPPQRIVSIAPSNTEILFALGLSDRVVAVDQYSNYPPAARQKAQLGSYVKPDLEQIVAAAPDLVLATTVHLKTVVPELEARRLTVFVLDPKTVEEIFDRIGRVGQLTGRDAGARRLVGELRGRVDGVAARVAGAAPPRVFFELSPQLHSAGPGTFVDDLIGRAGGSNIAGDAAAQWPQISQETVIARDPEVVLVAHGELGDPLAALRGRPGWTRLSAVGQGRVHAIDPDLVTRPGPRIVDGLEAIARALHPDRFGSP